jgi:hypothetical protein
MLGSYRVHPELAPGGPEGARMAHILVGLGLDIFSLVVLVVWLYRRRVAAPEMTMVFASLNIGLFAAVVAIGSGDFPVGVGFGLFGLLSLVRLRSAAFTTKDMAYTFSALVLALVNALPERHSWLAITLDVVVLGAMWLVDDSRSRPVTRVMRMTLDRAVVAPADVHAEVQRRLGRAPVAVLVEHVDYVRETTTVAVRHEIDETWVTAGLDGTLDPDSDAGAPTGATA